MAVPVIAIVGILANATTKVLTNPAVLVFALGWIVIARFDLGDFAEEARETVRSLWWVVVLAMLTLIVTTAIRMSVGRRNR